MKIFGRGTRIRSSFAFRFLFFPALPSLILSGNPLECVCENLWIKMRILEDADSQDLRCYDDKGTSQAFITLMPPDCGNVRLRHNERCLVLIFNISKRQKQKKDRNQDGQTDARLRSADYLCCFLAVVPKVVVTPGNVSERQGGNIRAVCKATGSPSPEIQWNLDLLASHHEVRCSTLRQLLLKASRRLTGPALLGSRQRDPSATPKVNTGERGVLDCLKAPICHTHLGSLFFAVTFS